MTAFLRRYFSLSAWMPSADFDAIRLNVDFLRHPEFGYIAVTASLLGFGACVCFHSHGRYKLDSRDRAFDETLVGYIADRPAYLHDFGPNVPVEDLGGKPCYYENGEPVYWEKAP